MKQKSLYRFGNSERKDGAMNFSAPDMMTHRKEFLTKIGLDFNKMVSTVLTHGSNIQVVTSEHAGQILQGFDGLVTSDPRIILTVTTADLFSAHKSAILDRDGKIFIDLSLIVKRQLEAAGVIAKNITISEECTYCLPEKYYSFRRDKPERVEAVLAYAMIA